MRPTFDPFRLLLISIAGWLGQQQREVIDYLQEENRVLRQQLGNKRLRLSDDQRRRLAAKAKKLGRRPASAVTVFVFQFLFVQPCGFRAAKSSPVDRHSRYRANIARTRLASSLLTISLPPPGATS
jgi:hypothetical protein